MDGRNIVLNDGTVIPGGECGYSDGFLWCWLNGYTMQQAASLFFDPAKTSRIVFNYGEMQDVYEGFTNCINLNVDHDGKVSVCLTKGAQ
jgi:hypothetical protein